jgi:hypothetical protein
MSEKPKLLSITRQQIEGIVFFVLFYLYLWLVVDLRLVPNSGGGITMFPVFYLDWNFFYKTCSFPGGVVEYLSSFLVQFFYMSWAGALVVTFQGWLIYFFSLKLLDSFKMKSFYIVSFIGPIIILAFYNKYIYFFNLVSGLSVALIFAYGYYLLIREKKVLYSLSVFFILSVLIYPIAGGAILLFAILCILYELFILKRFKLACTELMIALGVAFLLGFYIYDTGSLQSIHSSASNTFKFQIHLSRDVKMDLYCMLSLSLSAIDIDFSMAY